MRLVVDRERYYPMHSLIASYLSIKDIRNVKLVCKEVTLRRSEKDAMER
jgi:hypothetical protein